MVNRDFDNPVSPHDGMNSALLLFLYVFVTIGLLFSNTISAAAEQREGSRRLAEAQVTLVGQNLNDCASKLSGYSGGWCEIIASKEHPSISSVWPEDLERRIRMMVYDPTKPDATRLKRYIGQADWGDGLKAYDKKRGLVWSIHKGSLLAFDAQSGRNMHVIKQAVPHGKSLAFDSEGKMLSWNGGSKIFVFDPDAENEQWHMVDWGQAGPSAGDRRVYGKWRYIEERDLFVGLSIHTTGVWVYKHPVQKKLVSFSSEDLNSLIKHAKPGDVVVPPPGNYIQGILVNKSLTLKLRQVSLYGVNSSKGIINVNCNGCRVVIEDFDGDGDRAGCQSGSCAGVKAEGKNFSLTLRRAHIKGTVMGILTDNRGGELIVEDSLIEDTGLNDKSREVAHGLYAGLIDRVVIRNSTIRRPFGNGHVFKSRAANTRIENSVLAGMDGRHSRVVDFPCGGNLSITSSVIQQGDQTDNIDVISVGTEPKHCGKGVRASNVTLKNNWIILDRDRSPDERSAKHGKSRLFTWRAPVTSLDVSDNKIVESTGQLLFDGEEQLPDMFSQNQLFSSRQAAGLGLHQIPQQPN
ncbi:hypothetical protein [Sedimenticola hydrogenitrophicus]|uniref:hypothetical protein n=1 Tax=Sedimenticola hydrogenitrophicus TaxID=2967975 RepID=UPI0023B10DFC|nr:hypothetical protein [Sedimenticola hydrogenitrophicus]